MLSSVSHELVNRQDLQQHCNSDCNARIVSYKLQNSTYFQFKYFLINVIGILDHFKRGMENIVSNKVFIIFVILTMENYFTTQPKVKI